MYCLRDVIDDTMLNNWCCFVNSCTIYCQRSLSRTDIMQAHSLLKIFCNGFKDLYGTYSCVPNMHLMLHIKDCIFEYGSVYSFWCFSFERFNGILGSYHTNNQSIELQVMKKFVLKCQIGTSDLDPDTYNDEISSWNDIRRMRSMHKSRNVGGNDLDFTITTPMSKSTYFALDSDSRECISSLFQVLYGQRHFSRIVLFAQSYRCVKMFGEVFTSDLYRAGSTRNCYVNARFTPNNNIYRPAIIKNIVKVNYILQENTSD